MKGDVMETPTQKLPMPKKSCVITVMFGVDDDEEAMKLKHIIDEAVKDIPEKRYSFQLNEA